MAYRNRSFVCPSRPPLRAISVGTTPTIAIPVAILMRPVAVIVGSAPQNRCNDLGQGRPMIAIPPADDCGSLQLTAEFGHLGRPTNLALKSASGTPVMLR